MVIYIKKYKMQNKTNEDLFIEALKDEFLSSGELSENSINNVLSNVISTNWWTPTKSKEKLSKLLYNNNFLNNQNYTISNKKKLQAYNWVNTKNSTSSWIHEYYNGVYWEFDKSILESNSSFGRIFIFFFLLGFAMPMIIETYHNIRYPEYSNWGNVFFLLLFFWFAASIIWLMVYFSRQMRKKEGILFDNDN